MISYCFRAKIINCLEFKKYIFKNVQKSLSTILIVAYSHIDAQAEEYIYIEVII